VGKIEIGTGNRKRGMEVNIRRIYHPLYIQQNTALWWQISIQKRENYTKY
jgi:hypothetical protein